MESLVTEYSFKNVFKEKKIFVTGHTGFKGAWLITWLNLLGAKIKGYALAPEEKKSIYNEVSQHIAHKNIIADIRDKAKLKDEIISFQPDFIFHLAAQPLVRKSYLIPSETFEVNVIGTANLLESVIDLEKDCTIIIVTTDKVYENFERIEPYKETDRLGGYDPYSASKACTELITASFRQSFFNNNNFSSHKKRIATARAGNVIGGGDWNQDRIIPDIINHLKRNLPVPVRNPNAIRPWQHVLEPLRGYLMLAAALYSNEKSISSAFNFGPLPDDHISVKNLVLLSIELWGSGDWIDKSNKKENVHEAGILKLDIERAVNELNWSPKLNSRKAIELTIDWYKQHGENLYDFTVSQIKYYQSL
jgi:CDP-glucose 4,6-dehydratase